MAAMRIYLDYAATCPIRPEVLAAYTQELSRVGNPSSLHADGQAARMRMEWAREEVARAVGANTPAEVIFTSGGTESDNTALKGLFWAQNPDRLNLAKPVVMVSAIEHSAILETAEWLESQGAEIVILPVDERGVLKLDALAAALEAHAGRTSAVSVMFANNEIGTIQPIAEVVRLAHAHDVFVHTDAVQALGQVELNFAELGVDAMTVTAHKIGGPVGVGALILARHIKATPVLHGGGQERQIRSGTLDVPGAVAFATAATLAVENLDVHAAELSAMRDQLIAGIEERIPDAQLTGPRGAARLPANVHFVFPGAEGDTLLFGLDMAGFDTATGSACSAGVNRPSHVLLALGRDEDNARSSQRFSLGPDTEPEHIAMLLDQLPGIVDNARKAGMVSAAPRWKTDFTLEKK